MCWSERVVSLSDWSFLGPFPMSIQIMSTFISNCIINFVINVHVGHRYGGGGSLASVVNSNTFLIITRVNLFSGLGGRDMGFHPIVVMPRKKVL